MPREVFEPLTYVVSRSVLTRFGISGFSLQTIPAQGGRIHWFLQQASLPSGFQEVHVWEWWQRY